MKKHILLLVGILASISAFSQRGYGISSASYAYNHGGNGYILPSTSVVEEEIFNYHEHKIEAASYNDPVKISHLWGNEKITASSKEIILQLGIATHQAKELQHIPPANLSFVVDISGSMSGDPIEKSKEAMKELVNQLRPSDHVSLVLFGNTVFIPFKSQTIGDKKKLLKEIDAIEIKGSTNVHLGMQKGYEEVASTFLNKGSNRVIVFTDAMANTGVIDPQEILANTSVYIKDIDLTFIGIGIGFNQDFAREIKTKLRGHMHFVESGREITKLFKEEVEQFLTVPHGKMAKLTIEIPEQLTLKKFYGYEPVVNGNTIELELDDLQGGLTQIFLLKFDRKKGRSTIDELTYALTFNNPNDQPTTIVSKTDQISVSESYDNYQKLTNSEVKKNYSIAYMSNQLKQAAIQYESDQDKDKYYQSLNQVLATIDASFDSLDPDMKYVHDLLSKQTDTSKVANKALLLADNF